MKEKLEKLLNNSYAPYSNYRVSAILVAKDSKEFVGVNVENASFGATVCAERSAIFNAVSQGYKKGSFKELYVMVDDDKIGPPCFLCRQVMTEFFEKDMNIICMDKNNHEKVFKVSELCVYPFNEDNLR